MFPDKYFPILYFDDLYWSDGVPQEPIEPTIPSFVLIKKRYSPNDPWGSKGKSIFLRPRLSNGTPWK